jgi:hypothetical protein
MPWFSTCLYSCLKYVFLYTGHTGLTVASIYVLEVLCFIQKLKGKWQLIFHFNGYNTRGKTDLHTPSCNTASFQKSFVNVSLKLYNRLPGGKKKTLNFKSFNIELKFLLLNNFFIQLRNFCIFTGLSIGDISLYLMVICISYVLYSVTFYWCTIFNYIIYLLNFFILPCTLAYFYWQVTMLLCIHIVKPHRWK